MRFHITRAVEKSLVGLSFIGVSKLLEVLYLGAGVQALKIHNILQLHAYCPAPTLLSGPLSTLTSPGRTVGIWL